MNKASDEDRRPAWNYVAIVGIVFFAYWLYETDGCSQPFKLPRFSNGSKEKPVSLPEDMRGKITATAYHYREVLSANVYNGSDWILTRVDFNVTKSPKGPNSETRRFQLGRAKPDLSTSPSHPNPTSEIIAKPFSTTKFEAQIGDFFPQIGDYLPDAKDTTEWAFSIIEAYGYKE